MYKILVFSILLGSFFSIPQLMIATTAFILLGDIDEK